MYCLQLGIHRLASVSSLVEWIPYVRGARDDSEQNLEAVIIDSCLYYRSVRPIIGGSELRVWYNSELAKSVGVPDIHPAFVCGKLSIQNLKHARHNYIRTWHLVPNARAETHEKEACLRRHYYIEDPNTVM